VRTPGSIGKKRKRIVETSQDLLDRLIEQRRQEKEAR
jgi:hypothetical protein